MSMTELEEGSIWNTMPCHKHERRLEVYSFFDLTEDNVVFHMLRRSAETRHLVVSNEEAVICPSFSIQMGVDSSNCTFIWGMAGENQVVADMDFVPMSDPR